MKNRYFTIMRMVPMNGVYFILDKTDINRI